VRRVAPTLKVEKVVPEEFLLPRGTLDPNRYLFPVEGSLASLIRFIYLLSKAR
jgi:hypothetical protein